MRAMPNTLGSGTKEGSEPLLGWRAGLRNVNISIFGILLGTGGVALASRPWIPSLATALSYLLVALFGVFSALYALKLTWFPRTVLSEFHHPGLGHFYALQPISALLVAILGRGLLPSGLNLALLAYGAVVIFVLAAYLPYHFFADMKVEFADLHGGWFITPVATILVTNTVLVYGATPTSFLVALMFFGIGALLFLLILSILFLRLINHTLPPVQLAPTNFILLAPLGLLIVDILQLAPASGDVLGSAPTAMAVLMAGTLWGFGIWAVTINGLLLVRYVRSGFPFHLGWWSFVFPLAAFTLGTQALVEPLPSLTLFGQVLYGALVAVWTFVSVRTVILGASQLASPWTVRRNASVTPTSPR